MHKPAHHAILKINHGDDDQRAERHPLPAEKIIPGDLLEQEEEYRAYDRSPQGSLTAKQYADHHEDAQVDSLVSGFQWFERNQLES